MKKHILFRGVLFAGVTLALACATDTTKNNVAPEASAEIKPALDSVTSDKLLRHIKTLASDEFEGRAPGTKGEELTVNYLTEQFKLLGLKPGNPDCSYAQKVPLVGYTPQPSASFTIGGKQTPLASEDYLARSLRFTPETRVENSDVVFVGYGVVAPEYGWDDFKGVDVKGKTIVMLINDPAIPDPVDPNKLDEKMFKGKAMTDYGRWTYKYEIAREKGAAAAIIIHETGPAGYPFGVVKGSNSQEQFDVVSPDAEKRVPVEGWITLEKAKEILSAAGQNFDSLKAAATKKDFKPIAINAKATYHVKIDSRQIKSKNVVAKLEGTDKKDEYVVYSAHWDHLGKDTTLKGDQIYNGAADNASGSSAVLQIAKAFTKLPEPPKRSILFLMVTAEEKGLVGAKYYGTHPLYPLTKTAANINIDGINQWGKTSDFTVIGLGNSTLDDDLVAVLKTQSRTVRPDAEPEKGFYYRSDHFEFAKQGVPALDTEGGIEYIGKPKGYGMQKRNEYTEKD